MVVWTGSFVKTNWVWIEFICKQSVTNQAT